MQQFAEERAGEHRALAAQRRTAPAWIRCCSAMRAQRARVPGGHALTVDREVFAAEVTRAIEDEPAHRNAARRSHRHSIPRTSAIIATGPLTSDALADRDRAAHRIATGCSSTTASARSSMRSRSTCRSPFAASRYGKSLDGTDDYLNCPFDKARVRAFRRRAAGGGQRARRTSPKTTRRISKPACRSKKSRGAAATRCASVR